MSGPNKMFIFRSPVMDDRKNMWSWKSAFSELQIEDEHPMCQNGGFDEHATLQPALPPGKLPNEVGASFKAGQIFFEQVLHVPWTVLASVELRG